MKVSLATVEVDVDKCRLKFVRLIGDPRKFVYVGYSTTERDEEPNGAGMSLAKEIAGRHFGLLEGIRIKNWLSKKKKRIKAHEKLPLFPNLKNGGRKGGKG